MLKLSVITINLNNAEGLSKTLASIKQQTLKDFECILIDGGSIDESKSIIEENNDIFSYWVSERDKGVYHAMNKGIRVSKGEYLLFLNSGDHFDDVKILDKVKYKLGNADIVYGNLRMVQGEKSYIGVYPEQLSFTHFVESNLPHPGSFIKRTLLEKLGGYDESLKICSDWKFFLDAICRHNASFIHIDETIAAFYLDGLSSKPENAAIIREEKHQVLYRDYALYMSL